MATMYYGEHVHIAQSQIPTPYFCIGQESGNVFNIFTLVDSDSDSDSTPNC